MSIRFIFGAAALVLAGMTASVASAQGCDRPAIQGGDYTRVAGTAIPEVDLNFVCEAVYDDNGDGRGFYINENVAHYQVRVYGDCSPSNCDWGSVRGERDAAGNIQAFYNHGFATRMVRIEPMAGSQIRVTVQNWYSDGRPNSTWNTVLAQ